MKMFVSLAVLILILLGCDKQEVESSGSASRDIWVDELLLQLDELRSDQAASKAEVLELKSALSALDKRISKIRGQLSREDGVPFVPFRRLGGVNAPIALLEISDYECPYCARHSRDVFPRIKSEFVDKNIVQYGVLDYPLASHPGARKAAVAVRCAGEQGKYWEMYSATFADRGKTRKQQYLPLAEKLGLDVLTYTACFNNPATMAAVNADIALGNRLGVDGTPRFLFGFVNNGQLTDIKLLKGARDFEAFKAVIEDMQAKL